MLSSPKAVAPLVTCPTAPGEVGACKAMDARGSGKALDRALVRVGQLRLNLSSDQSRRNDRKNTDNTLIPWGFNNPLFQSASGKRLLHWMEQKDALEQDMFLVGGSGPLRRWAALHYCAIKQREFEYIALTRDTTESGIACAIYFN